MPRHGRPESPPHTKPELPDWAHELIWDDHRIRAFWEYAGSETSFQSRFFAELAAPYLVRNVVRTVRPLDEVLDLGTGTGAILRQFAAYDVRCIGLDVSFSLLSAAHGREGPPRTHLLQGDGRWLPFRSGSFSVIFILELLEHLREDVGDQVLKESARALREGGTLVVTTPANEDLATEMTVCPECGAAFHRTQHLRTFGLEELERLLERNGFRITKSELVDFYYVSSPFLTRLAKRLMGLVTPTNCLVVASKA